MEGVLPLDEWLVKRFTARARPEPRKPTEEVDVTIGVDLSLPVDLHQHLWPEELVTALRSRSEPPYLDGWTLHSHNEPSARLVPADHDADRRCQTLVADGQSALVALSSPLGIEDLRPVESEPLLEAHHEGLRALGGRLGWWAALPRQRAFAGDAVARRALEDLLDRGAAGLQVPATWLSHPEGVEGLRPLLETLQEADRPLFVHPGAAPRSERPRSGLPPWWSPVVDYTGQMATAWWAWHAAGRGRLTRLRVCFAAGAGLAPVHHERLRARGGDVGPVDPLSFVELSSYGVQGFDALLRALGIDVLVAASDHPYARSLDLPHDPAAHRALHHTNPHRLLNGGLP